MSSFIPRFSLRTLVIVVTLVCAYLACWGPTKRYAESLYSVKRPTASLPLIICQYETEEKGSILIYPQRYYLWIFGPKFKLPFESRWVPAVPPPSPPPINFTIQVLWELRDNIDSSRIDFEPTPNP